MSLSSFTDEEPKPEFTPDIERDIEESAERFEQKFSSYRMFVSAQLPGWVAEYKEELKALARKWATKL